MYLSTVSEVLNKCSKLSLHFTNTFKIVPIQRCGRVHVQVVAMSAKYGQLLNEVVILSLLFTLVQSQLCAYNVTKLLSVQRNGLIQGDVVRKEVRVCCMGYITDQHDPTKCVPDCQEGFINVAGSCIPLCGNCENGECMAPHQCKCNEGYVETPDGCTPHCIGCTLGRCVEPGKCECLPGYQKSLGVEKCKPFCTNSCQNGHCSKPEECTCDKGYRKSMKSQHECVSIHAKKDDAAKNEIIAVDKDTIYRDGPEVEGSFRINGKIIRFVGRFVGTD